MEKNLKIILKNQLKILKKATLHLNNKKKNYCDSSLNYLDSLEPTPGYGLIKYWNEGIKKIPLFFFLTLKNLVISFYEYKFIKINQPNNCNYKNIIISWSKFNNFLKDGSYNDPYFNTNSKIGKKCIWFLIHMDQKVPKKISDNIIIIKKELGKFNYIKLIFFFLNIKNLIININKIIHKQSHQTIIAHNIFNEFRYLLNKNVKKIIMPYEGQPFQNLIVEQSEIFSKNIQTVGFIHNFPPPLPTNLIYRNGSPSKIIVSGIDQKLFLKKYLGWSPKKIYINRSSRFIKTNKKMSKKIFLPGYIDSINFIIENLNKIKLIYPNLNIKNFKIQNHPQKLKSSVHKNLIQKIKKNLKDQPQKYNINNEKISIFVGSTGAIIEALECDCSKVIQIAEEPVMQIYGDILYPNVNIKILDNNIYEYSLKKRGALISFGEKKITFNKYLKI